MKDVQLPFDPVPLIEAITEDIYAAYPQLLTRYGEAGKDKCREDNMHHLRHLQTAFELENDQFFIDYAVWLNGILTSRGMLPALLIDNLERVDRAVRGHLSEELETAYRRMLASAVKRLSEE